MLFCVRNSILTMNSLETKLIQGSPKRDGDNIDYQCVSDILSGKLYKVLQTHLASEIFSDRSRNQLEGESLEKLLQECVNDYVSVNCSSEKQLDALCFGIANLLVFVQSNWTGPPVTTDNVLPWLMKWYQPSGTALTKDEFNGALLQCIVLDGEGVTSTVKHLELLLMAKVIFSTELSELPSGKWWLLRCLLIHQQMLDEPSQILYTQIFQLGSDLIQYEPLIVSNDALHSALHLELAQAYLQYSQVSKSEYEIKNALKLLKMEISLMGALGKRTRYQQNYLAQLTININKECSNEVSTNAVSQGITGIKDLPKNVLLEDEVCLDSINFTDPNLAHIPDLTAIEQAAVLALFVQTQKSHPKDNLQKEELTPYLNCVISQPKVWSIQASALLFRSRLELNHSRTVDRSLKQSEVLIECFNSDNPLVQYRLENIFCSHLPPRWKVEADFASILITLGAVQSALDVYLRLQMWDEVIACYNFLKLRYKAAEVIRQEMQKKETVKLWCMLGDATDGVECYKKAWEMSGERSAKAQRHWGNYYYIRKQYAESIPYLERSLSINSLQVDLWFRLGYAALDTMNWELCARAYHRYCTLEPESFEAWNNLAKAYVKQGLKSKAYHALKEAIKCNFENWKVWDNLMAVSTDCADFEQVIACYHRILDLKGKHADEEVLKIVVEAIEKNLKDCNNVPAQNHRKKLLNLFGRITSELQSNAVIWQLYSRLLSTEDDAQNGVTQSRIVQCLQRAHRAATQGKWFSTVESCTNVLNLCVSLADAYLLCAQKCANPQERLNLLSSAKFSLKGVTTTVKKEYTDLATGELLTQLVSDFNKVQQRLQMIEE